MDKKEIIEMTKKAKRLGVGNRDRIIEIIKEMEAPKVVRCTKRQ